MRDSINIGGERPLSSYIEISFLKRHFLLPGTFDIPKAGSHLNPEAFDLLRVFRVFLLSS